MEEYVSKLDKDLKKKLEHLCLIHNEPAWYVSELFAELRKQVDLDGEQLLNEIQSAIQDDAGKATKASDVNGKRLEFIRILDELEERIAGLQTKPQTSSTEAYDSLEQRVNAFKDSSDSLDDLEDSYGYLAQEILNKIDQLEKSILGEQTIIYCPSLGKDHLGSLVYFGDVFLKRQEIDNLMSKIYFMKDMRVPWHSKYFEYLLPSVQPNELSKSKQIFKRLDEKLYDLRTLVKFSKFWYIGKSKKSYSGYSAEGSSIERKFVSYQYNNDDEDGDDYLRVEEIFGFDISANLFDVYSSQSCHLWIMNVRMDDLHANLLPSPVDRLVSLQLSGVHFDSFDTHLLSRFTNLAELKMRVTFSKEVKFDLAFLGALRKLEILELTLPHLPSDLSAFKELNQLQCLQLESSSFFYAEKRPRLSKTALEQILSIPRLGRLELSHYEIELTDRELLSECKQIYFLKLTRILFGRIDNNVFSNIEPSKKKSDASLFLYVSLVYSDIRALNTTIFGGMTKLTSLLLTGNSIVDLPRGVFDDLTSLRRLELDKNMIRHISSGIFGKNMKLQSLKLDQNPIDSIEANAFAELHCLTKLSLVGCRLKSIDNEMFNGLRRLDTLKLNHNLINRIEVVAEDGRGINVAKADLSDEEKHVFADLISIESLNLSGNKLEKINLNCFSNLKSLSKLDLSSNMINELSGEVGPELLTKLREIMLNANQLTSIDRRSLPKNLLNLNLSNNRLKRLDEDFFAEFTQLKSVDLSENVLTLSINMATFANCNRCLESIDFSRNKFILAIEGTFLQMPSLRNLGWDLNESLAIRPISGAPEIRELTPEILRALLKMYNELPEFVLKRLKHLCLSECSIRTLTSNWDWKSELDTPSIGHFNLNWLRKSSWLMNGIDFSKNFIETLDDPRMFADFHSINKINLSSNRLSRIHRDIFKHKYYLHTIDLSGNNLSSIDMGLFRHIPKSLKHLNLSSNNIAFLNLARLFRVCPRLESLNVADNQLDERSNAESIDPRSIYFMKTIILANNRLEKMVFVQNMTLLEHLDLRGNRIETLMSNNGENLLGRLSKLTHLDLSQNRIRSLRDEMFDHLYHQLSFVDLSGNPCDIQLDSVLSELLI